MIPYFVFDHFAIGPVTLHTWGFFVGLAFAVGYLFTIFLARKNNIPPEKILWLSLIIFLGAALGSRVVFLLQFPREWLTNFSLLWRLDQGGLMLWGGILGAILLGGLYVKFVRLGFWRVADLVAPAIALGMGIGRVGCFLINDHLGAPTGLLWGILWPDGVVRHPVALYESLAGFGLFTVFLVAQKYLEKIYPTPPLQKEGADANSSLFKGRLGGILQLPGNLFLLFLSSYAVIRFFLDFLRASGGFLSDPHWLGLTTSQWISLLLVFLFLIAYYSRNRKKDISVL